MAQACTGGPCPFGFFGPGMASNVDQELMRQQFIQLAEDGMLEFGRFLSQMSQHAPAASANGQPSTSDFLGNLLAAINPQASAPADNEQPSTSNFLRNLMATMNQASEKTEEKQQQQQQQQQQQKENPQLWTANVPLGSDIKPEDLKITLKNHVMTIEVKKEQVSEDGSSRSYREFSKKMTIPDAVKMEEVKSVLQPDGTLRIEAPLPKPELKPVEEPEPTEIPVNFDD